MLSRFSFAALLLALVTATLSYQLLKPLEERRATTVADQVLEQVYLRALREFYELAATARESLVADEPWQLPDAILPYSSDSSFSHIWRIQFELQDMSAVVTPQPAGHPRALLVFHKSQAGQNGQRQVLLDLHEWLAGLSEYAGFGRLQLQLEYRGQAMFDDPQNEHSWFERPDFMTPDFVLKIEREPLLQQLRSSRVMWLVSLGVGLLVFVLLSLLHRARLAHQQTEQQLQQTYDELAGTTEFLREQMLRTAHSHKELLKRHYELKDVNNDLDQVQKRLLLSERLASLGEISAGIVHEINNPVAYIGSNLRELAHDLENLQAFIKRLDQASDSLEVESPFYQQLLSAYQQLDIQHVCEDAPEKVQDCIAGIERVKKIILDMKRLSSKGAADKRLANLNDDIGSVINIASNRLGDNITLTTELAELPDIFCNSSQIAQVVTNMIVNAIQALDDQPGEIRLQETLTDSDIQLTICDDGPGMSKEVAAQVFEPFFTTKSSDQGSGMGLALCYKIVNEHGGWIDLQTAPGEGCCFTIHLPLAKEQAEDDRPAGAPLASNNGEDDVK